MVLYKMSYMDLVKTMCEDGMYGGRGFRNFLTKEEKLQLLKEYKENLEEETKAVQERIENLKKNN